jgi:hypothetical protein
MKAVIYQFYEGPIGTGDRNGVELMKEYASRIGADHVFELDPSWPEDARIQRKDLGKYNAHYGAFKPIFDSAYDDYDYILFADTDVVPRNTNENIFDEMGKAEIGICEEWMQPDIRSQISQFGISEANDLKFHDIIQQFYGLQMPRDYKYRHRVFNSGCVVYSQKGRKKAQVVFKDFKQYVDLMADNLPDFYQGDQEYLNAMLPQFYWKKLDYKWNSQVFYAPGTRGVEPRPISDYTDEKTNFVHIQLNGAGDYSMEQIKEVIKYD